MWRTTLREAIGSFSVWTHVIGVLHTWILTLDLFLLSQLKLVGAAGLGVYGIALKISNLSLALPQALSNLFWVWLGQNQIPNSRSEKKQLWLFSGVLLFLSLVQGFILWAVASYALKYSKGIAGQEVEFLKDSLLPPILLGTCLISGTFLFHTYVQLRARPERQLYRVYVPWLLMSVATYYLGAKIGNHIWSSPMLGVAWANPAVALLFPVLLFLSSRKH
jgi:hypothetical protein